MRHNAPARMQVVPKELKEAKLKEFIAKDLSARRAQAASAEPVCYRLVARSIASPAVRALASVATEAAELGIDFQVVVLASGLDEAAASNAAGLRARTVADLRLLDAHEQLVLGSETAWIGDCMRRDPDKRDAYECFSDCCPTTAAWAAKSFNRIWAGALPMKRSVYVRAPRSHGDPALVDPTLVAIAEASPTLVAVRH